MTNPDFITIETRECGTFVVHVGDLNSEELNFDEMLGQIVSLTLIEKVKAGPLYAMLTDEVRRQRSEELSKRNEEWTQYEKDH